MMHPSRMAVVLEAMVITYSHFTGGGVPAGLMQAAYQSMVAQGMWDGNPAPLLADVLAMLPTYAGVWLDERDDTYNENLGGEPG